MNSFLDELLTLSEFEIYDKVNAWCTAGMINEDIREDLLFKLALIQSALTNLVKAYSIVKIN